jgi:hypothetical protein
MYAAGEKNHITLFFAVFIQHQNSNLLKMLQNTQTGYMLSERNT